jgi:signal transduction histidine kinase
MIKRNKGCLTLFFTTKEVGVGTGLGLSISYKIIEAYRGLIEVKSEINKGTCFKISLPTPE